MQKLAPIINFKRHAGAFSFTHFSTQTLNQRLNIRKHNIAKCRYLKDGLECFAVFGLHTNNDSKLCYQQQLLLPPLVAAALVAATASTAEALTCGSTDASIERLSSRRRKPVYRSMLSLRSV